MTALRYLAPLAALAALSCTGRPPAASPSLDPAASPDSAASEEPASPEEAGLPLAPEADRVDLVTPTFSEPTQVTNPLFPIRDLHAAVLLGNVDGLDFRTEVTLLPDPVTITLEGGPIEALESQYVAFVGGRLAEVALDWYAQDDAGGVWYLGEDVFNYADGVLADTEGTWVAGPDTPPALIMPADPQVGQVFRPENAWPAVFEEVVVEEIGLTVPGPHGQVPGAIRTRELHLDGGTEQKLFAPGYGEFSTGAGGTLEALAIASPIDALPGAVPEDVDTVLRAALAIDDAALGERWAEADEALQEARRAAAALRGAPPLLATALDRVLAAVAGDGLHPALLARDAGGARDHALDLAIAALDLQLRYRQATAVDRARFGVWARQLQLDVERGDPGAVAGDVTTLARIWERFAHTVAAPDAVAAILADLRIAADEEDLGAAADAATALGAAAL